MLGFETSDDAAVYQISPHLAAVLTNDFFTPIVDDPYDFGRIAAANALSDVYAMGAQPLYALALAAFPHDLPAHLLSQIEAGALHITRQAGVTQGGGTTLIDPEPKFGLCVLGVADPAYIWKNQGARPGDVLILTKPIGTGIMTTAAKRQAIDQERLAPVIESMATLNAAAASAGIDMDVHAATDVTGFGLIGHLHEMALASGVSVTVDIARIKLFDGVIDLVRSGIFPGKTRELISWASDMVCFDESGDEPCYLENEQLTREQALAVLCDPQTSGGLLLALAPQDAQRYLDACARMNVAWADIIGHFNACEEPTQAGTIRLTNGGIDEH